MARGRFITATLGASHKFASVKDDAHRLMFVLMVANTDVEGRLEADPRILNGRVFTLMGWEIGQVERGLQALADADLIRWYEVDGYPYAEIVNFHEHNSVRKDREQASKIKAPAAGKPMRAGRNAGVLQEHAGSTPAEVKVSQVQDKRSEGKELVHRADAEVSAAPTRGITQPFVDAWNEHRGPLPACRVASEKRTRAIRKLIKQHGDAALALFVDATCAVAVNEFYIRKQYGIDILLDGKVEKYAEQWRAGAVQLGEPNIKLAAQSARWAAALDALDERPVN